MIDTSGSIGMDRFQMFINFVGDIVGRISIGLQESLVGIILFGNDAHLHFNVRTYTDKTTLLAAINSLQYYDENTNTAAALSLLLRSAQDGTMGLRPGHPHIAILITDGYSTHNIEQTIPTAESVHASNIFKQVYAVGVNDANINELKAIASDPSLALFSYLFVDDVLKQLEQDLSHNLCSSSS